MLLSHSQLSVWSLTPREVWTGRGACVMLIYWVETMLAWLEFDKTDTVIELLLKMSCVMLV